MAAVGLSGAAYSLAPPNLAPVFFGVAAAVFVLGVLISQSAYRFGKQKRACIRQFAHMEERINLLNTALAGHAAQGEQLSQQGRSADAPLSQLNQALADHAAHAAAQGEQLSQNLIVTQTVPVLHGAVIDLGRHVEAVDAALRSEPWAVEGHGEYRLLSQLAAASGAGESAQLAVQRLEVAFAGLEARQEGTAAAMQQYLSEMKPLASSAAGLSMRLQLLEDGVVATAADLERLLRAGVKPQLAPGRDQ